MAERKVLVVANETIGGAKLLERVRELADEGDTSFAFVVPQNRPKSGGIIYLEAVHDAAKVRVDLARQFLASEGIEIEGEVGDRDPFAAAMDAIAEFQPDAVIVSTKPATVSGWLRRDLVERIRQESGPAGRARRGRPRPRGPAVPESRWWSPTRRSASSALLDRLKAKARGRARTCSSSSCPSPTGRATPPARRVRAPPGRRCRACARRACCARG